jgi:hypothetical protein
MGIKGCRCNGSGIIFRLGKPSLICKCQSPKCCKCLSPAPSKGDGTCRICGRIIKENIQNG